MKRLRVVYTATFECDVEVEDGQNTDDALTAIDIPEGGENASVYCQGSFQVVEVVKRRS